MKVKIKNRTCLIHKHKNNIKDMVIWWVIKEMTEKAKIIKRYISSKINCRCNYNVY